MQRLQTGLACYVANSDEGRSPLTPFVEATVAGLQEAMAAGHLTSAVLVDRYLERVERLDRNGPRLNSVIEINPDAHDIAEQLDKEWSEKGARGPLHGLPILLKDNIDTGDRMQTSAGSLALVGEAAPRDATVASRLRRAGAVILGKTNMSEWAHFRSDHASSGWSGRAGQCRNPYVLDRSPSGSSSGSGVAPAANLCAVAIGSETDGSIVGPASASGIVGIKPTVGLVSRAGVIPISHSQDTVGPLARTVTDAVIVLSVLAAPDPRDQATQASGTRSTPDYLGCLRTDGLRGARIGVARSSGFGISPKVDAIMDDALTALREAGAVLVDPASIATQSRLGWNGNSEKQVLLTEFKHGVNSYLSTRKGLPVKTLADVIAFNEAKAEVELRWFGQELLLEAEATTGVDDPLYQTALAQGHLLSRAQGIDAVMNDYQLDALVMPSAAPARCIDLLTGDYDVDMSPSAAAQAGYPIVSVPAGFCFGLPVNISFLGRAYGELTLVRLAYAFEQLTQVRKPPGFLPTLTP
jgi:amidase